MLLVAALPVGVLADAGRPAAEQLRHWQQQAGRGVPGAQFDLGLVQQARADEDPEAEARGMRLLRAAARQRLVDATRLLRRDALQAAEPHALDPQLWVYLQAPGRFTLQLASSRDRASIEQALERYELAGRAGLYRSERGGETRFALVYGSFESAAAARKALATLPSALRQWEPWVRRMRDVQAATDW